MAIMLQNGSNKLPTNFNEQAYLAANPDVAKAVASGAIASGAEHYQQQGFREAGRSLGNTPQTTIQPLEQSTSGIQVYDPTADVKAMGEARKKATIAGLDKAYQKSLSDLNYAKGQIEPAYYNQRNNVSTDSQIGAKNFAEYMASRGVNNPTGVSGTMAQSDISNNVALQGNLGTLAAGEAKAYADNAKQVADVNTGYNSDVASANAGIDAATMQDLINAQQQYNATKLNQANTDRQFNFNESQANQQQSNWQTQFDYTKATDAQKSAFEQAQFDYQKQQDAINNTYRQGTFEWQKAMDQAGLDMQRKQLAISQMKSSSSGSSANTKAQQTAMANQAWVNFENEFTDGTAGQWLEANRSDLINYLGHSVYDQMAKKVADNANQQLHARYTSNQQVGNGGRMLAE